MSNTAGALSYDKDRSLLATVEKGTGVTVLPHAIKKPGCGDEILAYFKAHPETGVTSAHEIAVVGDRLTTDMMLANTMGSWGLWVREGVVPPEKKSVVSVKMKIEKLNRCHYVSLTTQFARLERRLADSLTARGYEAPLPSSPFE